MLSITIPAMEKYDEANNKFVKVKEQTLSLEHSLVSLSKWESKWHKPFLGKDKTYEETIDYIKCMTLTQNVDPRVYNDLTQSIVNQIVDYIHDSMTATWFSDDKKTSTGKVHNETITSELIYYWMITLNVPVEFQKWHLNRLLTLIKVCNLKNAPQKKLSKRELIARNRALNNARRQAANSRG